MNSIILSEKQVFLLNDMFYNELICTNFIWLNISMKWKIAMTQMS